MANNQQWDTRGAAANPSVLCAVTPLEGLPLTSPGISVATVDAYTQSVSLDTPVNGAISYSLERSLNGSTGWSVIASGLTEGDFNYVVSTLTEDTRYYYRGAATDGSVQSGYSTVVNAITLAVPAAPVAGTPSVNASSITGVITDGDGAASYETRIDGGSPVSGLSVGSLTAETTYSVEHRGLNSAGNPGEWCTPYNATTTAATAGAFTALFSDDFSTKTLNTADSDWRYSLVTNERSVSGTQCVKMRPNHGDVAPTCGGGHFFANNQSMTESAGMDALVTPGHTVWSRVFFYFPSTFSFGYLFGSDAEAAECGKDADMGLTGVKWLNFGSYPGGGLKVYVKIPSAYRKVQQPS
ncbi:hypothetical protein J057_01745, partial [Marinobacter nanhaiticus D15-8W]